MVKTKIGSGSPWESMVGYSRALRTGNIIEVAGTVSVVNGKPYAVGDAYGQTRKIFEIIAQSLTALGASLDDVVRTRMFVTDINHWREIGKAHGEVFRDVRPVSTMVEVSKLIAPEYLVEIEVTAVLDK